MTIEPRSRALDKIYKRRNRYVYPEWQRQKVWPRAKRQRLIDSILRGWKLPKFYFLKTSSDPEEFEVVDGQQRLEAIFEFRDNLLPLSAESAEEFSAEHYKDLKDTQQDIFDDFEIEYDEIEGASEAEIKDFFQRLQAGVSLTSSERLNSVHSKLRDYAMQLAGRPFFKTKVTAPDTRYGHFDITSKAAAVEVEGTDAGLRYDDLRRVFEAQANFATSSSVAKRLEAALAYLDKGFVRPCESLRNRSVVQSLITLTCRIVTSGRAAGNERLLADFFERFMKELSRQVEMGQKATDRDYVEFQRTVNANVRSGPKVRHEVMMRKLLSAEPAFAHLLDPTAVAESGLSAQIQHDAVALAQLVAAANAKHAAEKGDDLFKPTNKTVLSQMSMGKVVTDLAGYKDFIDNLYFLFHEGVGSRLEKSRPESFRDVNLLRTALQHDVDHGEQSKARTKRRKLGETFRKYSGATSPDTLAPMLFQVVQANLLVALRKDLEGLTW